MVWRVVANQGSWTGPAKVIQQDGSNAVFCNNMGSILKAATEHIRPVSAVEARLIPLDQVVPAKATPQIQRGHPEMPEAEVTNNSINSPTTINTNDPENNPIISEPKKQEYPVKAPMISQIKSPKTLLVKTSQQKQIPQQSIHNLIFPIPEDADDGLVCGLLTCKNI